MTRCFPLFLRRTSSDETEEGIPALRLKSTVAAHKLLDEIMNPFEHGHGNLGIIDNRFMEDYRWPWAIIFFKEEFPLPGYVAELRRTFRNMPMTCYSVSFSYEAIKTEDDVPPVSVVFVRSKRVLECAARNSPLFAPSWEALRDKSECRRWLCISDSPPTPWIMETARGDSQRYLSVMRAERAASRQPLPENTDPKLLLNQALADEFYDAELWDSAIEAYRKVLGQLPCRADAMRSLAFACFRNGQMEDAVAAYREALKHYPGEIPLLGNYGIACKALGMLRDAEHAFRCILHIEPTESRAWINLADVHRRMGQRSNAIRAFETFLGLEPDCDAAWQGLGTTLSEEDRIDEAVLAHEQAVILNPHRAAHWNILGHMYAQQGHLDIAKKLCGQALKLDPQNPDAWDSIGFIYSKSGQAEKAEEAFRKALNFRPDHPKANYHLGVTYLIVGRTEDAKAILERLKAISPTYAERLAEEIGSRIVQQSLVPN